MARPGSSGDVSYQLARMLLDEPSVRQGIRVLQAQCLCGGLMLHFGAERIPATPSFMQHIEHYYMEFCRCAIESFMTVGFAPYRIRRMRGGVRVPEILPLGAFSWHVSRHGSGMAMAPWVTLRDGRMPYVPPEKKEEQDDEQEDGPLMRYDVMSAYCKEPVRVYAFVPPHPLFMCASPLVSVLPAYFALSSKRECVERADVFNSQPSIVLEQQDRTQINKAAQQGAPFHEQAAGLSGEKRAMGGRQMLHFELLEEFRAKSKLPLDSVALIAPTNHSVHSLDRVSTPMDVATAELAFSRRVASALGLPDAMLLQGATAVGAKSSAMGGAPSWSECAESSNRQLLDTCRHINRHLELLLMEVYEEIYGSSTQHPPIFRLVTVPTFSLDQIMTVWNAKLVDDGAFSSMLEASWGAPLGANAIAARVEQRKAEFELPFRDRKPTPSSKK